MLGRRGEAMASTTIGKLDFEDTIHGLGLVAVSRELSAGCLSSTEIDEAVINLKADLDAVASRMKAALKTRSRTIF
jgi:hypothetical protein